MHTIWLLLYNVFILFYPISDQCFSDLTVKIIKDRNKCSAGLFDCPLKETLKGNLKGNLKEKKNKTFTFSVDEENPAEVEDLSHRARMTPGNIHSRGNQKKRACSVCNDFITRSKSTKTWFRQETVQWRMGSSAGCLRISAQGHQSSCSHVGSLFFLSWKWTCLSLLWSIIN